MLGQTACIKTAVEVMNMVQPGNRLEQSYKLGNSEG